MLRQVGVKFVYCFFSGLIHWVLVDKKGAIRTLLKALLPFEIEKGHIDSVIDLPPTSRLYKTLLQGGHYNHSTQSIERVPSAAWDGAKVGVSIVDEVEKSEAKGKKVLWEKLKLL